MLSLEMLKRVGTVLLLTALVMPSTGTDPRAQQPLPTERQRRIVEGSEQQQPQNRLQPELEHLAGDERQQFIENLPEAIQAIESQEGRNSTALIDPWATLAVFYQEAGDHLLAATALERARQVVTINYGLYSLEEAPLLQQSILNAEAIGDLAEVWDLDQELLTLAGRHPNDLRTARILRDAADRRTDALSRYSADQLHEIVRILGCYYVPAPAAPGGPPVMARECAYGDPRSRLTGEASRFYSQAINILAKNGQSESNEIPAMLMELIHISYVDGAAGFGEHSLRYLLAYQTVNSAPLLTRIGTLVQIADWQLLYSRSRNDAREGALATYERAYESLIEHGIAQASIEQIFSPATPVVVLPAFRPNPLISEEPADATGYIDVAFEITRYGEGKRPEVLDSRNATRADERNVAKFILQTRFRPRIANGEFADSNRIVARYYLNE